MIPLTSPTNVRGVSCSPCLPQYCKILIYRHSKRSHMVLVLTCVYLSLQGTTQTLKPWSLSPPVQPQAEEHREDSSTCSLMLSQVRFSPCLEASVREQAGPLNSFNSILVHLCWMSNCPTSMKSGTPASCRGSPDSPILVSIDQTSNNKAVVKVLVSHY